MLHHIARPVFFVLLALAPSAGVALVQPATPDAKQASSRKPHHAIAGELQKIDKDGKTVVVKTADGTEEAFKFTERTTVHGVQGAAKAADLVGKEGSHVVVHYTGEGTEKTADAVEGAGRQSWKLTQGTIVHMDKAAHKVVVKTADGAEETYDLGKDATIDTKNGVVDAAHFTAKEGDRVVVYHAEEGGRKVVRFLKHIGHEM